MSSMSAVALFAALAVAGPESNPSTDSAVGFTPPAACLEPVSPPANSSRRRRHRLLPTVRIGFDYRPHRQSRARLTDGVDVGKDTAVVADSGRHQRHDRRRTRWTLSLRWTTGSSNGRPSSSPSAGMPASSCREYIDIRARQPASLSDAVDRYIEASRLRALLRQSTNDEVRHD